MKRLLFITILLIWTPVLFSQNSSNDSLFVKKLNQIENSTKVISNKIDTCCKRKRTSKFNKTNIKIDALFEINNKIDLTLKKIDSTNVTINSRIDSCCTIKVTHTEIKPQPEINNCFCIYKTGSILIIAIGIFFLIAFYLLGKKEFLSLIKSNFTKLIPHLPFVILVWTIGFCLFLNVYCKIDFNNLASINYNHQLLLLLSISLILLPFLKTVKIGKYLELERNIKETKEEVKDFKTEIRQNFLTLTSTVSNSINNLNNQVQTVNNYNGYPPPPPDTKLPELESEIDRLVKAKLKEHGVSFSDLINVPVNNIELFKIRYSIEIQLRRIWEGRFANDELNFRFRHKPIIKIIQDLSESEIIDKNFYGILREILSICNYAIHGEEVTDNQFKFVENSSKQVLDYLRYVK